MEGAAWCRHNSSSGALLLTMDECWATVLCLWKESDEFKTYIGGASGTCKVCELLSGGLRWELVVRSFTQCLKHLCPWQFHCLSVESSVCYLPGHGYLYELMEGSGWGRLVFRHTFWPALTLCFLHVCTLVGLMFTLAQPEEGSVALLSKSQQCAWIQWWHEYTIFLYKENCAEKSKEDGRWELQLIRCGGL